MGDQELIQRFTRSKSRNHHLDVDLNAAPPVESQSNDGNLRHSRSQDAQAAVGGNIGRPAPIDLETNDDDVIISSPRAFAEARKHVRGNRKRPIVVDVEPDDKSSHKRRRIPANQTIINGDLCINLEGKSRKSNALHPTPPPPPPVEQTLNCPICLCPFVEPMTTKCGHIFCKACIKTAITKQSKCPNCRKKTTTRDIIRVYLPSTTLQN